MDKQGPGVLVNDPEAARAAGWRRWPLPSYRSLYVVEVRVRRSNMPAEMFKGDGVRLSGHALQLATADKALHRAFSDYGRRLKRTVYPDTVEVGDEFDPVFCGCSFMSNEMAVYSMWYPGEFSPTSDWIDIALISRDGGSGDRASASTCNPVA